MMQSNLENPKRPMSSVEILKAHMEDLPVRNLDTDWIKGNKVDLESLMKDRRPGI
ncbi:hypothetical protein [uncultured Methanolobus sp.]|uniref:hypothetical protein n=1 Tax=uncultured Methanolobus sp. TaxID=218300 RepID=UPI0029C81867|nr:hypothetical protein [uncultured Methanolobus sp.]